MPATPRPPSDTPPDPAIRRLADLDDTLTDADLGARPRTPADGGDEGALDDLRVRPEHVDFLLRLHQLGAAWRDRTEQDDRAETPTRIDRFEIVREVGQGGFATVYEANDTLLGRRVALKVAHPDSLLSSRLRRRFLRAAELASRLSHPNLVTIFDLGESDGVVFIAEEFCSGGTLATWFDRHPGQVGPRLAALVVKQLAEALDVAHEAGIIHRDIKPENVLLAPSTAGPLPPEQHSSETPAGTSFAVKLGDFGLARLDDDDPHPLTRLTRAGAVLGTPAWMAPEQIDRAIGAVGPATDVHALGLLLDRLLVGRCRWQGSTDSETMRRILLREAETVDIGVPGVPRDLLAVCRTCLARRPGDRYGRAGDVAADLSRFLLGVPTLARPLSAWERACRWAIRRPAVVAGIATALLATLIACVALWGWSIQYTAVVKEREHMRRMEAANNLACGLDDLRIGNVSSARERFADAAGLDPALDVSFAGRWARRQLSSERTVLFGAPDGAAQQAAAPRDLFCCAVSPDGRRIATGAADGRLVVIDAEGRAAPTVVPAAHDEINDVAFSPDGRIVATAGQDGRVRLWSADTGTPVREVTAGAKPLFAVCWSLDGTRLAWGGEEMVLIVDRLDGTAPTRFPVPLVDASGTQSADIEAATFFDDSSIVVAGGRRIVMIAAGDGHVVREFIGHAGPIGCLDISPDRRLLVSGGSDSVPRIWDVATGTLHRELPRHPDWVQGCTFTSDGGLVVTGCRDSSLRVFDATTGEMLHRLTGHAGKIWDVRREEDGTVVSTGADGTVRRFQPHPTGARACAHEIVLPVEGMCRALPLCGRERPGTRGSDTLAALIVPTSGTPIVVDAGSGRPRLRLPEAAAPAGTFAHAAIDRDQDRLALLSLTRQLQVVSLRGESQEIASIPCGWYRACWTPAGQCLAATIGAPTKIVGRGGAWDEEVVIDAYDAWFDTIAVSPGGGEVAAGGQSVLRITPISRRGQPVRTGSTRVLPLGTSFGHLYVVAWSPDGHRLAVGSKRGNVRILDANTGAIERILPGHRGLVTSMAWSADGRIVISADEETVRICDADTAVAIDTFAPGWTIRSVDLFGPPEARDHWLVVGGDSPTALHSADGTPGHGRLLVVDLER